MELWETGKKTTIPMHNVAIAELLKKQMIQIGRVTIVTDGSSAGNPGISGWCAILLYPSPTDETIDSLVLAGKIDDKMSTNNIAELTAMLEGIKALKHQPDIIMISDSSYAIGAISGENKVKANKELVYTAQAALQARVGKHTFKQVEGHGINCPRIMELADARAVLMSGSGGRI